MTCVIIITGAVQEPQWIQITRTYSFRNESWDSEGCNWEFCPQLWISGKIALHSAGIFDLACVFFIRNSLFYEQQLPCAILDVS